MPQNVPLKERLLVRLLRILSHLPLPWSRRLGRTIGWLAWHGAHKQRHFSQVNITHCYPHLNPGERERLAKASMLSSGELLAEVAATWLWPCARLRRLSITYEGLALVDAAYAEGRGVLIAAPHLGNWELLFPLLSDRFAVAAMYKPPRMKSLDTLICEVRERDGGEMFPASARGVRAVIKALRAGKLTFVLPDQEPGTHGGVFVPFFGQSAWTMTLPGRLLKASGCTLLYACVLRTPAGFKLVFRPSGITARTADEEVPELVNQGMQALIELAPEQYQWSYKRFYTQPPGQSQIYL